VPKKGTDTRPAMELVLMIRPLPAARIDGKTACMARMAPK